MVFTRLIELGLFFFLQILLIIFSVPATILDNTENTVGK